MSKNTTSNIKKTVNLALQGGGSHGAFTWGVLDKLLEDGRLDIEGICATSAGTMNACVLASGFHLGGAEKARESLHDFWRNIYLSGQQYNPLQKKPWESILPWDNGSIIENFLFDSITRVFSPYQFNPLDINPLKEVVEKSIDFDALNKCDSIKLFISATKVSTGKVKVFNTNDITVDVVMASACLPFLFKAVEVDGEDYWDGGYIGNPAIFPLFYETNSNDIMIVHINPMVREETPTTAPEIMNRINEISFNSSLLKEMRAIAFVKKLLEHDMLKENYKNDFKKILIHSVKADDFISELPIASKLDSDWDFLVMMRDKGREVMTDWLEKNFDDVGKRDTVDLHTEFLNSTTLIFENLDDNKHHTKN